VRPPAAEVRDILPQHAPQVRLAHDQEVVQALAPDTAEEALAGGVRPQCPDGRMSSDQITAFALGEDVQGRPASRRYTPRHFAATSCDCAREDTRVEG
jgi:hypothetical protein